MGFMWSQDPILTGSIQAFGITCSWMSHGGLIDALTGLFHLAWNRKISWKSHGNLMEILDEHLASQPGEEKKPDGPDGDDQIDDKTHMITYMIHMMMKQLIENLGALPYMMAIDAIDAIYLSGDVYHHLPSTAPRLPSIGLPPSLYVINGISRVNPLIIGVITHLRAVG